MNLVHCEIEQVFLLQPGIVNVLVVESERDFFRYCREFYGQTEGLSGNFCLSEGEKILNISKCCTMMTDFFDLPVQEKRFASRLYQQLQTIAEERCLSEYAQVCEAVHRFFARLNAESDCAIDYEAEQTWSGLFKAFGVKLAEGTDFPERLSACLRAHSMLLKTRCCGFVNLKTILSEEELLRLYHESELQEMSLFLFENTLRPALEGEKITLIDRDLCEIVVKD